MEINEKIVECWLRRCNNMFTLCDITYDNYNSAIDVLGVNLEKKPYEVWDIEVKFRTGICIADTTDRQRGFQHICNQLLSEKRTEKIDKMVSSDCIVVKKLITTEHFFSNKKEYWREKFADKKIEVCFFEQIVSDLQEYIKDYRKSNDDILQVFKLLNICLK